MVNSPAFPRNPWKLAALLALAGGVCATIFALRALYPYSNDDATHYLIARGSWTEPISLIDFWGRPAFTLLHAVPAHFGYIYCRLLSVLLSVIAALMTFGLARRLKLERAAWVVALVFVQPAFFELSYATLTETVGAVILVGALWLWAAQRYSWAGFVFSLLPLARAEGFFILLLVGCWYLWKMWGASRQQPAHSVWPWLYRAALLATGTLVWNLIGAMATGNVWWLLDANSYAGADAGYYGFGRWYHFLLTMPLYLGAVLIPPFVLGLWRAFRATLWHESGTQEHRKIRFLAVLWVYFFVLQTVLWTFGLFKSAGYYRFFVTVAPVMAIVSLIGLNATAEWLKRRSGGRSVRSLHATVVAIGLAITVLQVSPMRDGGDYTKFERMDTYYRDYVAEHGRPKQVFCNYHYFDFLHDLTRDAAWRTSFTLEALRRAPAGTLVLWVYPYERQATGVEPKHFYTSKALQAVGDLARGGKPYLHHIHETLPGWKELADFSDVERSDDRHPFFQKVLLKTADPIKTDLKRPPGTGD
jgi:hypothetical protein